MDSKNSVCPLCSKQKPVVVSHVIPAFVFRWLKSRGPTGHIRKTDTPNRRVQDGLKKPWLCVECEQILAVCETQFATRLFHPWLDGARVIAYEEWLLRFCVSVSWRTLKHCKGLNPLQSYTSEQDLSAALAEKVWREYLIGARINPGEFQQHLIVFDEIVSTEISDLPENINRWMTGTVEHDIAGSARSLYTFTKLGRFVVFGFIKVGGDKWDGTKVTLKRGVLRPCRVTLPGGVLEFIKARARHTLAAIDGISQAQHRKIADDLEANIDKLEGSEAFSAILADGRMFGRDSVVRAVDE